MTGMQSSETGRAGNRRPIPASVNDTPREDRRRRDEERHRIPWLYGYVLDGDIEPEPQTDFTTAAEIVEAVMEALGRGGGEKCSTRST